LVSSSDDADRARKYRCKVCCSEIMDIEQRVGYPQIVLWLSEYPERGVKMFQDVTKSEFVKAFSKCRHGYMFSRKGLMALYDHLCNLEKDIGVSLDSWSPEAICCNFTEYKDLQMFQNAYGVDYQSIDEIKKYTKVIPIDDKAFIALNF